MALLALAGAGVCLLAAGRASAAAGGPPAVPEESGTVTAELQTAGVVLAQASARPPNAGIFKWNGQEWLRVPGAAVRISVGPDGSPWIVQSDGSILRWLNGAFEQVPGKAKEIGVGASGAVWIIGSDDGIYRWNGQAWDRVPGAAVDIGVGADGSAWMVGTPGTSSSGIGGATGSIAGGPADGSMAGGPGKRTGPVVGIPSRPDAGRFARRSSEETVQQKFQYPPSVIPDSDSVTFRFVTAQATVPIVEVSTRPPEPGPKFDKEAVVAAAFPALAGKQTRHSVRVGPLTPRTHYYYIITIADEEGPLITETGEFTTSVRID